MSHNISDNTQLQLLEQPPTGVDPQAVLYRTTLCEKFAKGKCRYGPRCMFAHGCDHLRTQEMNVEDGLITMDAIRQYQARGRQIAERKKAEREEQHRTAVELRAQTLVQRATLLQSGAFYCHQPYAPTSHTEAQSNVRAAKGMNAMWRLPGSHNPYAPFAAALGACDKNTPALHVTVRQSVCVK